MEDHQNKTEKQIADLIYFLNSHLDPREMKRALAVKLALQRYVYRQIEKILNVSPALVSKWEKNFLELRIERLKLTHKGAKGKLSKFQEETIKWLLSQRYWDISELEIYLIEEYDLVFKSKESYHKNYWKAKITRQKAEKVNPRKNPEEEVKTRTKKNNQILEAHRDEIEAGKPIAYAIDKGNLMGDDLVGEVWGSSKERVEITIDNYKARQTY